MRLSGKNMPSLPKIRDKMLAVMCRKRLKINSRRNQLPELPAHSETVDINRENLLVYLQAAKITPENSYWLICRLALLSNEQKLTLILREKQLFMIFQEVFTMEIAAEILGLELQKLNKLADEIPIQNEHRIKEIAAGIN